MSKGGFINNGLPLLALFNGDMAVNADTENPSGETPASGAFNLLTLATALAMLSNNLSQTPSDGARWYGSFHLGAAAQIAGIAYLIGGTGGTDKVIVELHKADGTLVATSALAGVLVGTANTVQQVNFTAPYEAAPGDYFIALQFNGNTARFATFNAPGPLMGGYVSSTAAGTFGTSAAITPPTTYTAGDGPVAMPYQDPA